MANTIKSLTTAGLTALVLSGCAHNRPQRVPTPAPQPTRAIRPQESFTPLQNPQVTTISFISNNPDSDLIEPRAISLTNDGLPTLEQTSVQSILQPSHDYCSTPKQDCKRFEIGATLSESVSTFSERPYGLVKGLYFEGPSMTTTGEVTFGMPMTCENTGVFGRVFARDAYDFHHDNNQETDFGIEGHLKFDGPCCSTTEAFVGYEHWTVAECNNHVDVLTSGISNCSDFGKFQFRTYTNLNNGELGQGEHGGTILRLSGEKLFRIAPNLSVGPYVDSAFSVSSRETSSSFYDGALRFNDGAVYATPGLDIRFQNCDSPLFFDVKGGYQFTFQQENNTRDTPVVSATLGLKF